MDNKALMVLRPDDAAARLAAIVGSTDDAIIALSRNFVELHGGPIVARSEGVGKGAEFQVDLPIRAGASSS